MGDPVYRFVLCSAVLQYTAICQYGMEHCTVSYHTSQDGTDLDTDGYLLMEVP